MNSSGKRKIIMRVRQVRIGERFVLDDRGGVFVKTGERTAKCLFGHRDVYGREVDVDENAYCFVIFKPEEPKPEIPFRNGKTRVVIYNEDDDRVLFEIPNVSESGFHSLIVSETVRIKPPNERASRTFHVVGNAYDVNEDRHYLFVNDNGDVEANDVGYQSVKK